MSASDAAVAGGRKNAGEARVTRNAYTTEGGRVAVADLQEEPAVPPFDPQGDERAGYLSAGTLLIVLGWGFAVVVNLVLHALAPSGGHWIMGVFLGRSFGDYAWAVLGLGLVTGALGATLIGIGRSSPKGRLVLPGYDY